MASNAIDVRPWSLSFTTVFKPRESYWYVVLRPVESKSELIWLAAYNTTFVYDPLGNRLLKNETGARTTSSYDVANQLERSEDASGVTTYTFDRNGNQHESTDPSGARTTYQWDYENQLIQIRNPDASRVTMSYNADFRRVQKIE